MLKVANSVISASRITGVLPVANGGTGVTTSTGTGNTVLSASPTLSGDVTLSTGNLVIGTAGKGIDFSITSSGTGTMTSELLADYEEGTWTPIDDSGAGLVFATAIGFYTKIGNMVYAGFHVDYPATANASQAIIGGLPFTSANYGTQMFGAFLNYTSIASPFWGLINSGVTNVRLRTTSAANITNVQLSSGQARMTVVYRAV